ncbi:hypothetical protein RhiirC2_797577, partial [Rhizophagus irregularis]
GKKASTCISENLHANDITKGLEFIGNLLINIAHTGNNEIKKNILIKIFETLLFFLPLKSDSTTSFSTSTANTSTDYKEQEKIVLNEPPSLFMIKTLFIKIYKEKECKNVEINDFNEFGHTFGQKLWNSRLDVNLKKSAIESPQTIQEYYNAFPEFLKNFFSGMIDELYEKKMSICNFQRKKHNKPPKVKISGQTIKIVTFITSMLLSLAFPHLKVWLPQVLASLSHRYERTLAKIRMETSDPTRRLIQGSNVWNLAIIDNIDFKEKSFKFGNIYDVTRGSSHATLRMAFQIQLPIDVETGPEKIIELTAETPLFGMNKGIDETLAIFQQIIYKLLDFKKINEKLTYETNFNAETIKPDEAIFRRLIKCKEKWPHIRPLLGQWHTSKDFCSVLIVLFSSYGLLSLASRLGVRFLDKFESAVDFRSTARVLDLIWVAVGVAINIYITEKGILFSEIMNNSLSAAGSLYASAAKSNYTTAITHFLTTIAAHPQLEEKLRYCGAFKIPYDTESDPENVRYVCFGFDETLETFGVRFIKGNISGNIIDEKNLKIQIKHLRVKESLWKLVNDLVVIFGMDDLLSHQLFQNYPPTEIHQEGLDRLILCYSNGLERIKGIYWQEVLKIESRVTKGRRAVGVVRTKVKDYNNQKKLKHQYITDSSQSSQKNTDENLNEQHLSDAAKPQSKQKKHRTTDEETNILSVLKVYKDKLPDDAIASVCNQLSEVWTKKKVRDWWNYHKDK